MFFYETSKVVLIAIIFISKDIQILSLDLQFNAYRNDLTNSFKILKENIDQEEEKNYLVNKRDLNENNNGIMRNEFEKEIPNSCKTENYYDDSEDQDEKKILNFDDQSYDDVVSNFSPSKISYSSEQILCRREVPSRSSYTKTLQNSSLHPFLQTKALEINSRPSGSINTGETLYRSVAQKLNTSTLDLAKKITNSQVSKNDDKFSKIFQNYNKSNAPARSALNRTVTQSLTKKFPLNIKQKFEGNVEDLENDYGSATSSLATILDQILIKLESIHTAKNNDEEEYPEGAPCDIVGTWSSSTMGFCFDIQLFKEKINISAAELNNKILSISLSECVPAKRHTIIDLDWKFTGSAIKQWGGPFYVYGQKRRESTAATFLGFCRKCAGRDTIFGSWNLLSPSKDCQDISLASDVKRDILIRVRMETKRKERLKGLLYKSNRKIL